MSHQNKSDVIRHYKIIGKSDGTYQMTSSAGETVTLTEKERSVFQLMLSILNDRRLSERMPEFSTSRH